MTDAAAVRYVVAGAGGMGREALAWARDAWPEAVAVGFWTAADGAAPSGAGTDPPVLTDVAAVVAAGATHVVLGVGDGGRRRAVADEAVAAGLALLTVVHPTAFLGPGVEVGAGAVVAPGAVLTRDVTVGVGTVVNYRAAVGHGGRLGAYVFLGPAAALAGDVAVGDGTLVGIGAVVLPGRRIGAGATIGAGAVVTRDVDDGATVAGNPARPTG